MNISTHETLVPMNISTHETSVPMKHQYP